MRGRRRTSTCVRPMAAGAPTCCGFSRVPRPKHGLTHLHVFPGVSTIRTLWQGGRHRYAFCFELASLLHRNGVGADRQRCAGEHADGRAERQIRCGRVARDHLAGEL